MSLPRLREYLTAKSSRMCRSEIGDLIMSYWEGIGTQINNYSPVTLQILAGEFTTHIQNQISVWPKFKVKDKIRSVLSQRILSLTLVSAQNLKHKMVLPILLVPVVLLMSTGGTQSDLGNFSSEDGPTKENPSNSEDSENCQLYGESGSGTDDENSKNEDQEDERGTGLIYARVSSSKQRSGGDDNDEDGISDNVPFDEGSITGQIEELEHIAEREDIELPYDPIVDEAKSGTDFNRDGIQEVFTKAKEKNIDYLLVEKVDRVGRSAAETLYFIYILQSECGVTLLTSSGERDVGETHGLMHATLLSLMAEIQNELRTTKASKERIRKFLNKQSWKCRSPKIPLGYDETDDGWLEVNSDEKPIVRDLFKKFVECENYAETERYIDGKYGSHILDGHKVKTVLQNSVYIGKPRLPESWLEDTTYENDLDEPELHLLRDEVGSKIDVDEGIFHQAQDIIEKKEQERSNEDTYDLLDFIEEYSLFAVIEGSDPATLLHHCGEPLVKDGQLDLNGEKTVHRYKCKKCEEVEDGKDYYRKWPKQYELNQIRLIQQVIDGDGPDFIDPE